MEVEKQLFVEETGHLSWTISHVKKKNKKTLARECHLLGV